MGMRISLEGAFVSMDGTLLLFCFTADIHKYNQLRYFFGGNIYVVMVLFYLFF